MIEVRDLRKSYGAIEAVAGISFTIADGETFGLLGPNGAGKTTTMHLLGGVLRPDGGDIVIQGESDPKRLELRRRIGLAPQALALYDTLTADENLAFFARLYGLTGAKLRRRVDFAIELAGLAERRRDRVGTYSGGMKRRLNLACAIVHEPQVLFLDEPTAGVDPQSRNYLFENIETLARQGCTVVYTTHYMEEAQRLCKRVAIMDHGKILALDTVAALIAAQGGQATVEVELAEPPPPETPLPAPLQGLTLRYASDRPDQEPSRLTGLGLRFTRFVVDPPNLERVFLNLTGRNLRD